LTGFFVKENSTYQGLDQMTETLKNKNLKRALVTVFEDFESAKQAIGLLQANGFDEDHLELVSHHVSTEAPEVLVPKEHETTASSLVDGSFDGATLGLGIGAIAALVTPFPGLALGMIAMGGLTGAIIGGMAGIEHAVEDDCVNLPSVDEYEQLVRNGRRLVVVLGSHEDAIRAKEVISEIPYIHLHVHSLGGHEFHEHPAKD